MILKKQYNQPKIDQIEIDVSISLQTESGLPGDPFDVQSTSDTEKESSFDETDDSGFSEDPFKR